MSADRVEQFLAERRRIIAISSRQSESARYLALSATWASHRWDPLAAVSRRARPSPSFAASGSAMPGAPMLTVWARYTPVEP